MVARRVLTLAAVGALLAACFSDLPEAATCPPQPQRVVGDCAQLLRQSNQMGGCIKELPLHECLLGPRTDCSCGASECPESASACFPAPDCPASVRAMVPSATCLKPAMADVSECACGCAGCVAVCDGYGPTLGVTVPPGAGPMALLNVSLGSALPASGKLGYYVRLRGAAQMVIIVAHGRTPLAQQGSAFSDFQSETPFREVILAPAQGASWSSADMAPTTIVLMAAPGSQGNPSVTYVQVDCVLPILMQ